MVVLAHDSFSRVVPLGGGWGRADSGQEWVVTAGVAFTSVNGAAAQIDHTSTGRNVSGTLGVEPQLDIDVQVTWWLGGVPSGGAVAARLYPRYQGSGSDYHARVSVAAGTGSVNVGLYRADAAILKSPVDAGFVVTGPSTKLVTRVQAVGSSPTVLRAKTWPLGGPEPDWQVAATDSTVELQTPSVPGIRIGLSGSTVAPFVSNFDDFTVTDGHAALPATVYFDGRSTVDAHPTKRASAHVSLAAVSATQADPTAAGRGAVVVVAGSMFRGEPASALHTAVTFAGTSRLGVASAARLPAAVTFKTESKASAGPNVSHAAGAEFASATALRVDASAAHPVFVEFGAHGEFTARGRLSPIPKMRILTGATHPRALSARAELRALVGHAPTRSLKGAP